MPFLRVGLDLLSPDGVLQLSDSVSPGRSLEREGTTGGAEVVSQQDLLRLPVTAVLQTREPSLTTAPSSGLSPA